MFYFNLCELLMDVFKYGLDVEIVVFLLLCEEMKILL